MATSTFDRKIEISDMDSLKKQQENPSFLSRQSF